MFHVKKTYTYLPLLWARALDAHDGGRGWFTGNPVWTELLLDFRGNFDEIFGGW